MRITELITINSVIVVSMRSINMLQHIVFYHTRVLYIKLINAFGTIKNLCDNCGIVLKLGIQDLPSHFSGVDNY